VSVRQGLIANPGADGQRWGLCVAQCSMSYSLSNAERHAADITAQRHAANCNPAGLTSSPSSVLHRMGKPLAVLRSLLGRWYFENTPQHIGAEDPLKTIARPVNNVVDIVQFSHNVFPRVRNAALFLRLTGITP
jgi:hypothetical protein